MNVDSLLAPAFINPIKPILALKDSLTAMGATPEQIAQLQVIADTLDAKNARAIAAVKPAAESIIGGIIANRATGRGAQQQTPQETQQLMQQVTTTIQPAITAARTEAATALTEASTVLGPDIWGKLPNNLKTAAPAQGGRGSFNGVAILDRMLANPIPVLLGLKDTLKLTPEQVTQIETISTGVTTLLNNARADLGKKFDNVAPQEQLQVYQGIQPQIEDARKKVTEALKQVEKVMTSEQWKAVPEQIRNPFANQQGMPGGRRGGLE